LVLLKVSGLVIFSFFFKKKLENRSINFLNTDEKNILGSDNINVLFALKLM
jgi:regulatory protein YycI of two-component signal transduction system YycFG